MTFQFVTCDVTLTKGDKTINGMTIDCVQKTISFIID